MIKGGRKRFFAILLAAFVFPACNFRVERDPGFLADRLASDPTTLNPMLAAEMSAHTVTSAMFSSLLEYDNESLELKGLLASSWKISDDHLSYEFTIRKNVLWHDGAPLTADDVVFTFSAIRDKRVDAAVARSYFDSLVSVDKIGERDVIFRFSKPNFKMLAILGLVKILPRHVYGDLDSFNSNPANDAPVGSGPFCFESWKRGNYVKLRRFDRYFGTLPKISGIKYSIVPSDVTAFALLKKGALDKLNLSNFQWRLQSASVDFAENFMKTKYYPPNYSMIAWNMRRAFFDDVRVRTAMGMLVNRNEILAKIFFGNGEAVTGPFYRFGRNYDSSVKPLTFDPSEALRLIEDAGWVDRDGDGIREKNGVPFRFEILMASGDRTGRSIAVFLKEELARIGIEMSISALEWGSLVGRIIQRDFDAAHFAFALPLLEDPYSVWHSSQSDSGSNFMGLSDPEVDSLIEKAMDEFDDEKRSEIMKDIHRRIALQQPSTFLFTFPTLLSVSNRFGNVKNYKVGVDVSQWTVNPWKPLYEW